MLEIPHDIKQTLRDIGLDRTEIQVYMLLLKKNLLGIQEITKELSLPRSSVHLACENLLARGVLRVSLTGKRRNFYIEGPDAVRHMLAHQENKLESQKLSLASILPQLAGMYATARDAEPIEIQELVGEDGFVEVFMKTLDQKRGGEVMRFGGDPSVFTVARDRLVKYREERMKRKIYARILQPESPLSGEEIKDARFKMREVRVLPREIYDPHIQAALWDDRVAITVWDKGLHSVIIKNHAVSEFMKQLFELAWGRAGQKVENRGEVR